MAHPLLKEEDKSWPEDDSKALKAAVVVMETPTLTAQITNLVGTPIEYVVESLPASAKEIIHNAIQAALNKAADYALWTLDAESEQAASPLAHKLYAATSGAVGGAFGFAGLPFELPITTIIILRSIAEIAREQKFDLTDPAIKLECINVFAMGGKSSKDDASDAGYYATRLVLANTMRLLTQELGKIAADQAAKAAGKVVVEGVSAKLFSNQQVAKYLADLIEKIAQRFGATITEKAAGQLVPVIGAVVGATLNTMFTDYYQDIAKAHFSILSLERKYGQEEVQLEYDKLKGILKLK
jgi:hypothetical protein